MTSTADIWQCFTDNTLAYVDPNNESIHELLYASLGIYGAALCALMASRCRLGRDANTLRLMLQFLQSLCVVWYGVVTMWSIIPASQNRFKICFADSAAPSSGCVNYVQTFSGVSTAATVITILGAWIPLTFTFYARTQPSLTTNPSPSFRALRYVLMFAGDVLTLLITPGYIAVESRELDLGNCLLSPLALYERELSGTHIGILCVLALACGIDLIRVQWGSADSCVASVVVVVVTIVWGLSVSVARMATTQADGWVPYLGSVWVPVFVAVLHELLFLCLIGRPWWFDDPPEESLTAAAVNPADVTVGVVVVGDGDVDTPTVVDATVVSLPTQPIHDVTIVSS